MSEVGASVPFQRFLMALSVRPGSSAAILVHFDPNVLYAEMI